MHARNLTFLLVFLPVVGCFSVSHADPTSIRQIESGKEFELRPGQQAVLANELSIRFESVNGDSRCPSDVTCIQEGNASVVLSIISHGGESQKIELNTARRFSRSEHAGIYSIELVQLLPYPRSDRPIATEDYGVTLVVTKY
ncbi:MAG: hypothetical protein ABI718_02495 [Acidobacteriota bacterium]